MGVVSCPLRVCSIWGSSIIRRSLNVFTRSSHLLDRFIPGLLSKKSEQDFQLFGATPRAIRILRLRQLSHLNE